MPGGQSLYFFKLVPSILIQTHCSSTSYILVRVRTYRTMSKEWWGGLQFPTITPSISIYIIKVGYSRFEKS